MTSYFDVSGTEGAWDTDGFLGHCHIKCSEITQPVNSLVFLLPPSAGEMPELSTKNPPFELSSGLSLGIHYWSCILLNLIDSEVNSVDTELFCLMIYTKLFIGLVDSHFRTEQCEAVQSFKLDQVIINWSPAPYMES